MCQIRCFFCGILINLLIHWGRITSLEKRVFQSTDMRHPSIWICFFSISFNNFWKFLVQRFYICFWDLFFSMWGLCHWNAIIFTFCFYLFVSDIHGCVCVCIYIWNTHIVPGDLPESLHNSTHSNSHWIFYIYNLAPCK